MLHKWWVLAAVACGTFMATLDSSIVNIALPSIIKELGSDLSRAKWVIIAYLLVITCLLLPFGRLSDQYGRKKVYWIGFLIFTIGSAFCGMSPNMTWLIISRAIQGIGAAMLMANSPAIITASFPASERGMALGTMAMVVSAGLVTGPSFGGFLTMQFGWRSVFLVNIPIGILGMLLVHRFVIKENAIKLAAPFDWAGAILQSVVLISFIILFDPPQISVSGSTPFPISRLGIGIITVVVTLIFLKVEAQAKAPLFDMSLLRNRTFWTANLASFLTFVAYSSVSVLMPFFLEEVMHFSTKLAGLYMTAIPLTIFVIAPLSGRLSDRFGSQELSFLGALIGAIALFIMSGMTGPGLHPNMNRVWMIMGLCTIGFGTGLFQSPNNNAIMSAVPHNKLGVASALLATIRNLGLVTGTGLSTGLFSWKLQESGDFISALHFTHFIAALVGIGAMLAALGKHRGPHWVISSHLHHSTHTPTHIPTHSTDKKV